MELTDPHVAAMVAGLPASARAYVLATPALAPADAGWIAYHAGDRLGGGRFASFAKHNPQLFQRLRNCYDSAFVYRLTSLGLAVRDAGQLRSE